MGMHVRRVRGLIALAALALVACAQERERDAYLDDAAYRRASLEASLVNPANAYSQLRLARYGGGGARDWEKLPEWNPRVEIVQARELDAAGGVAGDAPLDPRAGPIDVSGVRNDRGEVLDEALGKVGEQAFFRYPVQLSRAVEGAVTSRAAAATYGMWVDDAHGVGGLVRVELADGSRALAMTCATCHSALHDSLVVGVGNNALDLGRLFADRATAMDDERAARLVSWGPGRVDVTTSEGTEPVRIPDLRPVRLMSHLQQSAAVRQRDRTSLAIRIETLLITSQDEAVRPPREIALGLAAYVWSLSLSVPGRPPATESEARGEGIFDAPCSGCHRPPSFSGPPVPFEVVGTDPTLARSTTRGTGFYRVPSLLGVATRGFLLHDASVKTLDAMFDPRRTPRGHNFGLDLGDAARADLLAYLRTL